MTNMNKTNSEIRGIISTALRAARMTASVERSGLSIEHGSHEVVVTGNTFPVKGILKAAGFRWSRNSKSWCYKTVRYSNLTFSCDRLMDGTVHRRPAPTLDMGAICRALAS